MLWSIAPDRSGESAAEASGTDCQRLVPAPRISCDDAVEIAIGPRIADCRFEWLAVKKGRDGKRRIHPAPCDGAINRKTLLIRHRRRDHRLPKTEARAKLADSAPIFPFSRGIDLLEDDGRSRRTAVAVAASAIRDAAPRPQGSRLGIESAITSGSEARASSTLSSVNGTATRNPRKVKWGACTSAPVRSSANDGMRSVMARIDQHERITA